MILKLWKQNRQSKRMVFYISISWHELFNDFKFKNRQYRRWYCNHLPPLQVTYVNNTKWSDLTFFYLKEVRWGEVRRGEVTLQLTDSQSVCLGIEHPCGTCDQILRLVGMLLSEICGHVFVGRPVWREDGSAICSVITQWSESRKTRNFTVSSETPPTWRARFPYLYPPGTGWPSYTPGHWVPFTSSLTTRRATVEIFEPSPYIYPSGTGWSSQSQSQKSNVKVTLRPMTSQSVCFGA
jgi:hypothetical protein